MTFCRLKKRLPFAAWMTLLALAATPCAAQQGTQVKPEPPQIDRKACADRDRLTLGDTHELQGKGTSGLSDKLARTDGVICPPPDLDPDIRRPAPDAGRTPVLPPPTEADPNTRPK